MSNTQSIRQYAQEGNNPRLHVQEHLDSRRAERNEELRKQAQKEEERREDLLEALFLENLSTKTRLNRIRSEQRQAPPSPTVQQKRRSQEAQRRRREAEEEAQMRASLRRTKMGYSVIGHMIIIIVLAFALNDGLVARELVTPFSCCVCLIFGFDGGRIWNEILHFFNDPARKTGDLS